MTREEPRRKKKKVKTQGLESHLQHHLLNDFSHAFLPAFVGLKLFYCCFFGAWLQSGKLGDRREDHRAFGVGHSALEKKGSHMEHKRPQEAKDQTRPQRKMNTSIKSPRIFIVNVSPKSFPSLLHPTKGPTKCWQAESHACDPGLAPSWRRHLSRQGAPAASQ